MSKSEKKSTTTTNTPTTTSISKQRKWSIVSILFMSIVLGVVHNWHHTKQDFVRYSKNKKQQQQRRLQQQQNQQIEQKQHDQQQQQSTSRFLIIQNIVVTDTNKNDQTTSCDDSINTLIKMYQNQKDPVCLILNRTYVNSHCNENENIQPTMVPMMSKHQHLHFFSSSFSFLSSSSSSIPTSPTTTDTPSSSPITQPNNNNNDDDDDDHLEQKCCPEVKKYQTKLCSDDNSNHSHDDTHDSNTNNWNQHALKLLGIMMVFIICGCFKSFLRYANICFIPDAGACIIVGIVVGFLIRTFHTSNDDDNNNNNNNESSAASSFEFDNDLFLRIMLPPIIFEAALTINKPAFQRNIFPILVFSIFGTMFSALSVGYTTYYLSQYKSIWHNNDVTTTSLPLLDSLLFGALMSSIDPVATLSILSGVGMEHTNPLYILIFGESLLNDGVSIVLFDSLIEHMGDTSVVTQASVQNIMYDFICTTTISMMIGFLCGIVATIYFYMLQTKQNDVTEVSLFFVWALIPYYIADGLQYSGIIAIMVMGFMMHSYIIGGAGVITDNHNHDNNENNNNRNQLQQHQEWIEYLEMRCNNHNNPYDQQQQQHPQQQQQHQMNGMMMGSSGQQDEYMVMSSYPSPPVSAPFMDQLQLFYYKAFSGHTGHLLQRSKIHVNFVAEVLTNIMETAIFTYLGLFVLDDEKQYYNLKLVSSGIFSCISSRAVMVVLVSFMINVGVFMNLQRIVSKIWKRIWNCILRILSNNTSSNRGYHRGNSSDDSDYNNNITGTTRLLTNDDNDTIDGMNNNNNNNSHHQQQQRHHQHHHPNQKKHYLNSRTQFILFSAGIRGAVSYALVQNIPMYDNLTKTGSHYKSEIRVMTSITIIVLLFGFGAVTYFTVHSTDTDNNNNTNTNTDQNFNGTPPYYNNDEYTSTQEQQQQQPSMMMNPYQFMNSGNGDAVVGHNHDSTNQYHYQQQMQHQHQQQQMDGNSNDGDINSLLLNATVAEQQRRFVPS